MIVLVCFYACTTSNKSFSILQMKSIFIFKKKKRKVKKRCTSTTDKQLFLLNKMLLLIFFFKCRTLQRYIGRRFSFKQIRLISFINSIMVVTELRGAELWIPVCGVGSFPSSPIHGLTENRHLCLRIFEKLMRYLLIYIESRTMILLLLSSIFLYKDILCFLLLTMRRPSATN